MEDVCSKKRVAMELREQYMGLNHRHKRQLVKPSYRLRSTFDWPVSEDTSRAFDEGFDATFEAPLLFGRGFRAGIDRLEQKKRQLKKQPSCSAHKFLPPCWAAKQLSDMTPRDWRIFQEDFNLSYKGFHMHAKRPMRSWEESGLSRDILKAVHRAGYWKPSPIQMAAIPISLAHVDVIGIAHTGSGSTCSHLGTHQRARSADMRRGCETVLLPGRENSYGHWRSFNREAEHGVEWWM